MSAGVGTQVGGGGGVGVDIGGRRRVWGTETSGAGGLVWNVHITHIAALLSALAS